MIPYAEDMNYWKTGKSSPEKWIDKAVDEIEKAGGFLLSRMYGSLREKEGYVIVFEVGGDQFRLEWPVLKSKYEDNDKRSLEPRRRQAATMLYHDVKARCVAARVIGFRRSFHGSLLLPDGRAIADVTTHELESMPKLLTA